MVEDVQRRGGNSLVVYPPVHTSIWDLAIEPMDIEPQFEVYKVPIANKTLCYDFEWRNSFSEQNHWYADGFHFRLDNALEQFTYAVFTGESDSLKILGPTNAP